MMNTVNKKTVQSRYINYLFTKLQWTKKSIFPSTKYSKAHVCINNNLCIEYFPDNDKNTIISRKKILYTTIKRIKTRADTQYLDDKK